MIRRACRTGMFKSVKQITAEEILNDENYGLQIALFGVFGVAGLTLTLYPFLGVGEMTQDRIIMAIILLAAFGIPFGYCLGVRRIYRILRTIHLIKKGEYLIAEDELTDKYMGGHGKNSDTDDSYCQFTFSSYSARTQKNVIVSRKEHDKAKVGDLYYLVFLKTQTAPIRMYPKKEYFI